MNIANIGRMGEFRAEIYLRRQGMRILYRRYRTAHGEIDLIAKDGDETVFVEVKTRPRGRIGDGVMAVDAKKRAHMRFSAQYYLRTHPNETIRFDVIEISAAGPRHIKNAF